MSHGEHLPRYVVNAGLCEEIECDLNSARAIIDVLLEALEEQEAAEKYIEEEQGSSFFEETYPKMLDHAAALRRSAIAKAKGGRP
jgi:hypothetical protein